MKKQTKSNIFFFVFLFIILTGAIYNVYTTSFKDGFANFKFALGGYPDKQEGRILPRSMFPYTNNEGVSTCTANMIWKNYPEVEVGNYAQETNNIRYPPNPDQGTCTPAEVCGALYKNRQVKSNEVEPLPPVESDYGQIRVNYYNTKK